MNKNMLPSRPLVCFGDYWKPIVDTLVASGETDGGCVFFASSIAESLQKLDQAFDPSEMLR